MARRLICKLDSPSGAIARIYRDTEWDEYVVTLYCGDRLDATYHSNERQDAFDTAREMLTTCVKGT